MLETTFPILALSPDGKVKHKNASAKSAFKMPKVNTYIHRYLGIGYDIAPYFSKEDDCFGFIELDIPSKSKNSLCAHLLKLQSDINKRVAGRNNIINNNNILTG